MTIIKWKDDYSVYIGEIDDQHKNLLKQLNDLHDALLVGKGKELLGNILQNLVEYTQYHFSTEEKYFEEYNYPQKDDHKKEHSELVEQVAEFQNKFTSGKTVLTIEVLNFLKDWLNKHLQESDREFGIYLKEKLKP